MSLKATLLWTTWKSCTKRHPHSNDKRLSPRPYVLSFASASLKALTLTTNWVAGILVSDSNDSVPDLGVPIHLDVHLHCHVVCHFPLESREASIQGREDIDA